MIRLPKGHNLGPVEFEPKTKQAAIESMCIQASNHASGFHKSPGDIQAELQWRLIPISDIK